MIFKNIKKIITLILIFSLVSSFNITSIFAESNEINGSEIKENNGDLSDIFSAIDDVVGTYLENANIKGQDELKISQNTFHPNKDDYFGNRTNVNPIYKVVVLPTDAKRKNKVALTFDSAYINNYTYQLLDILDEHKVKATFFMTAEWATRNPSHVLEIAKRGHEIGNHTYQHPNLNTCDNERVVREIMTMHNYIKGLLNIDMCLFRFPYGSFSPRTIDILKELGYYPIQWTFDSIDWREDGKDSVIYRFMHTDKIGEGSIILMHNGAKDTPEALPAIFDLLDTMGLESIKVSDLIYKHSFYISNGNQIPVPDYNGNYDLD